jgi:DNA-binding CsgD family transcriptional regulator
VLSSGASAVVRVKAVGGSGRPSGVLLHLRPRPQAPSSLTPRASPKATFGRDSLTETERSVSELVAQGLTNREVGERLFISKHTVDSHRRCIFRKLGLSSRVQLVRAVLE